SGESNNLTLRVGGSLDSLIVKRSLENSLISVLSNIGSIKIGKNLNRTNLIGGINIGEDFLLATNDDILSGSVIIHSVFVRGDMIDSSITAGINPNGLYFGDGDDTAINDHLGTARINRIIIKGDITSTLQPGESYAISADDGIELIRSRNKVFNGAPGVTVSKG
ncbi:MAG: hypothetical protein IID32_05405, partial [Planctomycetes bacterium]|nr:hypothetical protein [Planctomycetota bacterium]